MHFFKTLIALSFTALSLAAPKPEDIRSEALTTAEAELTASQLHVRACRRALMARDKEGHFNCCRALAETDADTFYTTGC